MYDLLIVGAGITAATAVALLIDRLKIRVVECRAHLGGNGFDFLSYDTRIHAYGPHIFHCAVPQIVASLSRFTDWTAHAVEPAPLHPLRMRPLRRSWRPRPAASACDTRKLVSEDDGARTAHQ